MTGLLTFCTLEFCYYCGVLVLNAFMTPVTWNRLHTASDQHGIDWRTHGSAGTCTGGFATGVGLLLRGIGFMRRQPGGCITGSVIPTIDL